MEDEENTIEELGDDDKPTAGEQSCQQQKKVSKKTTGINTVTPFERRESPRLKKQRKEQAVKEKTNKKTTLVKKKQDQPNNNTSSKPPKPPTTKAGKGNGGIGRARGKNFITNETMYLLKLVRDKLPSGGEDWDWVTQQYNDVFSDKGRSRDKESPKRRFAALHNRRTPTGDPD